LSLMPRLGASRPRGPRGQESEMSPLARVYKEDRRDNQRRHCSHETGSRRAIWSALTLVTGVVPLGRPSTDRAQLRPGRRPAAHLSARRAMARTRPRSRGHCDGVRVRRNCPNLQAPVGGCPSATAAPATPLAVRKTLAHGASAYREGPTALSRPRPSSARVKPRLDDRACARADPDRNHPNRSTPDEPPTRQKLCIAGCP